MDQTQMITKADVVALLHDVLRRPGATAVRRIQALAWDTPESEIAVDSQDMDVLRDLAYDLEYVLQGSGARDEDASLFGPERARAEIQAALIKIEGAPAGSHGAEARARGTEARS